MIGGKTMLCPRCNITLRTSETYNPENGMTTYRRKKCEKCGRVLYTKESVIDEVDGRKIFYKKLLNYKQKNL